MPTVHGRSGVVGSATVAVALGAASVVLQVRSGHPGRDVVLTALTGLLFVVGGLLGSALYVRHRLGLLMVGVALSLFAEDLQLSDAPAVHVLGLVLADASTPMLCHLALAFPYGRLGWLGLRLLVVEAWVAAVGLTALTTSFLQERPGVVVALTVVQDVAVLLTLVAVVAVLARRARRATPALRRVVLPPYAVGLALGGCGITVAAADLVDDTPLYRAAVVAFSICFLLLPLAYLLGVLRTRLSRARVGALVLGLSDGSTLADLEDGLRTALDDPTLRVLPDAPADETGRGSGRATTAITHEGRRLGLLEHDPSVGEDAYALRAMAAAAGLVLHNLRLAAESSSRLSEVQATAGRLVAASDQARRRVERDLHDGAQQQLLGVALRLRLLESALPDQSGDVVAAQVAAAAEGLESALADLRALARGLFPTVLAEAGLETALATLADRCPVPVALTVAPLPRLPADQQATLYYAASEALTNVVRHANATSVTLRLAADQERGRPVVRLGVTDDGVGGVRAEGAGLTGLRDRARAAGGDLRLTTPPGGGTDLVVTVGLP